MPVTPAVPGHLSLRYSVVAGLTGVAVPVGSQSLPRGEGGLREDDWAFYQWGTCGFSMRGEWFFRFAILPAYRRDHHPMP